MHTELEMLYGVYTMTAKVDSTPGTDQSNVSLLESYESAGAEAEDSSRIIWVRGEMNRVLNFWGRTS